MQYYLIVLCVALGFAIAYVVIELRRTKQELTREIKYSPYNAARTMRAYILFRGWPAQTPAFPSDPITEMWMTSYGINKYDPEAIIYHYLEKGLKAEKDENH